MAIDKEKVRPVDETDSPMERANERVEAEMKALENETKEQVADGLKEQPLKKGHVSPRRTEQKKG